MSETNGDQANGMNGADLSIDPSKAGSKMLWRHPSPQSTLMFQFVESVNREYGLRISNYKELHKWSVENIDQFWGKVWQFVGVRAECQASTVSDSCKL
jgi:acetoacetyl-CoA synthetase